jgi:hypothetical protein
MNNVTQYVINAFNHPALRDLVAERFDQHRAKKIVLAALPNGPYEFQSPKEYKEVDWNVVAQVFNQRVSMARSPRT